MRFRQFAALALFLASASVPAWANPLSTFAFASSPTSYVGGGEAFVLSAPTTSFSVKTFGLSYFLKIEMYTGTDDYWLLQLTVPDGTQFETGTYQSSTEAPNVSAPSMALGGNHRGGSFQTGTFDILGLAYDPYGAVSSLAVDFFVYDNIELDGWNSGQIRINSDVPVAAVPEPSTYFLMAAGMVCIFSRLWRQRPTPDQLMYSPL